MDIELARTFIEIVGTGSFIKAADPLHVAQTTVSARVRLLEQQLGRPLFVRNKRRREPYASGRAIPSLCADLRTTMAARKTASGVPEGHRAVLTIGSEVSLWEPLLVNWVRMMRHSHPDIALRVHVDVPHDLITHVAAGLVDIAIMYAPQHRPGLEINLLKEEELVLVTTDLMSYHANDPRYVHVEWGTDFSLHHAASFPDTIPGLVANLGPLALNYLREACGQPLLASGELYLCAPQFSS